MVDVERLAAGNEIHHPEYNAANDCCDDAGTTFEAEKENQHEPSHRDEGADDCGDVDHPGPREARVSTLVQIVHDHHQVIRQRIDGVFAGGPLHTGRRSIAGAFEREPAFVFEGHEI